MIFQGDRHCYCPSASRAAGICVGPITSVYRPEKSCFCYNIGTVCGDLTSRATATPRLRPEIITKPMFY